ncbi:ankyrin repeat-containing domain protein [Microdochium bolleyi]|uniref:Ankyrin repeat-containing domain protein n=1 Tax=Microdochium bolleyi TaxID=196109 RepID=A0A136IY75_9PEZI|nr:ankyrin repeat-containing domain protein [Microdochium bolleyi]
MAIQRVILCIEKRIKENRIQDLLARIASCTTILQLSLGTLALGALWDTQDSQAQIQAEIRKLAASIRSATLFSKPNELEDEGDWECVQDARSVLDEEIQEWRKTADDVVTAVSDRYLDRRYRPGPVAPGSSVSLDISPRYEEDNFDPEPDHLDVPSRRILEYQLAANQDYVKEWRSCGLFLRASAYQRNGIEMEQQLQQIHGTAGSANTVADMKETLVVILLECETEESTAEAMSLLKELLRDEINRPPEERDMLRRYRLYHMLGDLYYRQGMAQKVQQYLEQAKKFFERAFEGRQRIASCPPELIKDSAEGLVHLLQIFQEYDRARGIQDWIRFELQLETALPGPPAARQGRSSVASTSDVNGNLSKLLQWCKERHIDVDARPFGFDIACKDGKTPIQFAIMEEDVEILRDMLLHVANVDEQRDGNTYSTPLHMAASKRNKYLVGLLLDREASAREQDEHGMVPLHRCQSASGGVKVAELLLDYAPATIDCQDTRGKTALYMACEYGNEKMVALLLRRGACPNIKGSGACTPLILAIELASKPAVRTAIIKLLLDHGADPRIHDAYGRSAFDAASNCGLGGHQIREMLAGATLIAPRSHRSFSMSSVARSSTSSKMTSATGSSRYR